MQSTAQKSSGMALNGRRIAIIGGGIGGMAAACALAGRGVQVVLFEQAAALGEVGAGLQISPNGVAVLDALGLKAAAQAHASAPDAAVLLDSNGRQVASMSLGADAVARWGQPYWQFHRADLLECLYRHAVGLGVTFRLGAAVQGQPDGQVNGEAFDAVIAADGVRSTHRAAHFGGAEPQFLRHMAWRALIPAEGLPDASRHPAARLFMGRGRHFVAYPLRGGTLINLVGILRWQEWVGEGWSERGDGDAFRLGFAQFGGDVPAMLERVNTCYRWGLFGHAPVANWSSGRLALLGDACHPTLPFLAQGATQALEDAWQLAESLSVAADMETGLADYAAMRKGRADRVVAAAARSGRLYHLENSVLRAGRNAALRLASTAAPAILRAKFDWIYRQKPANRP